MEINEQAVDAEVTMVMIVRDGEGNPKFDDPHNVPEEVLAALTLAELDYLNQLRAE